MRRLGPALLALLVAGCIAAEADRAAAELCARPGSFCADSPLLALTPPSIQGYLEPCAPVQALRGGWQRAPESYSYDWLRCSGPAADSCVALDAHESTFTIPADFAGSYLGLRITAHLGSVSTSTTVVSPAPVALPSEPPLALMEGFDYLPIGTPTGATPFDEVSAPNFVAGRNGLGLAFQSAQSGFIRKALPAGTQVLTLRFAYRDDAFTGELLRLESAAGDELAAVRVVRFDQVALAKGPTAGTPVISRDDAWNVLQLRIDQNAGFAELRVNGVSSRVAGLSNASAIDELRISAIKDLVIDDFALGYGSEFLPDRAIRPIALAGDLVHVEPEKFSVSGATSFAAATPALAPGGSYLAQHTASATARLRFALQAPPASAQHFRFIHSPAWTEAAPYPATLRFKSPTAELVATSGTVGEVHHAVAGSVPTQTACALAQAELSWGEAATVSPEPRLEALYVEGTFTP